MPYFSFQEKLAEFIPFVVDEQIVGYIHKGLIFTLFCFSDSKFECFIFFFFFECYLDCSQVGCIYNIETDLRST